MPRTKVPKKNAAKRDRNSVAEEVQASLLRRLDEYNAEAMMDMKLNYEQRLESFADIMQNLRDSLPKCVMNMTMGELAKFNLADYNNSTIGGGADKSHKKIVTSRDDDGKNALSFYFFLTVLYFGNLIILSFGIYGILLIITQFILLLFYSVLRFCAPASFPKHFLCTQTRHHPIKRITSM